MPTELEQAKAELDETKARLFHVTEEAKLLRQQVSELDAQLREVLRQQRQQQKQQQ